MIFSYNLLQNIFGKVKILTTSMKHSFMILWKEVWRLGSVPTQKCLNFLKFQNITEGTLKQKSHLSKLC